MNSEEVNSSTSNYYISTTKDNTTHMKIKNTNMWSTFMPRCLILCWLLIFWFFSRENQGVESVVKLVCLGYSQLNGLWYVTWCNIIHFFIFYSCMIQKKIKIFVVLLKRIIFHSFENLYFYNYLYIFNKLNLFITCKNINKYFFFINVKIQLKRIFIIYKWIMGHICSGSFFYYLLQTNI